jgi:hypothetical protein
MAGEQNDSNTAEAAFVNQTADKQFYPRREGCFQPYAKTHTKLLGGEAGGGRYWRKHCRLSRRTTHFTRRLWKYLDIGGLVAHAGDRFKREYSSLWC